MHERVDREKQFTSTYQCGTFSMLLLRGYVANRFANEPDLSFLRYAFP